MRRAMLVALTALALGGCQSVWGFKDFKQGAATGGSGGGGGSGGSAAACTDAKAPSGMVGVRTSAGTCVWVDKHEVTRGDYMKFLANPPANPPTECAWNTSLKGPEKKQANASCVGPGESAGGAGGASGTGGSAAAGGAGGAGGTAAAGGAGGAGGAAGAAGASGAAGAGGSSAGAADPDLPVTCIDYCDALTYCVSVGKSLCSGKYNSPKSGDWYDACSGNGNNDYPYGRTHQPSYCNDSTNTSVGGKLVPVGTESQCVTQGGIEDLVGNASEWVDECTDASENADCEVRGGSFLDDGTNASCTSRVSVQRPYGFAQLGFRCCWQPSN